MSLIARGVPIAHVHGGEHIKDAFDNVIRHSIINMMHLHFGAGEGYRKKVIHLGEHPKMCTILRVKI